ncbi:BadM/Rrf2 family transcriptional regulator [Roseimicrobium gellanilyticum]|uniref:BadM/Rrf2 family transcriptional regulator n=1 Tax=Roseimicrobium gellanilyticum TaxID=748857 RepID=A0A366HQJ9_9BACT|nr:Rrf2 family transcriptional regulator [Roseimicrobium gellanilyticum]RBP45068.1 BadM/Rrf2 family transcriptional regulator [Roseimicrobium gellanilyticum]
MKISKKAEYALRALVAMSRSSVGTVFSIQTLATEESIPLKFLEQILLVLRKGGLLTSRRGAGGGYQLARAASRISVGEVLELIDGPLQLLPGGDGAGNAISPGLVSAFRELNEDIQQKLSALTLADVLQREQARGAVSFEI